MWIYQEYKITICEITKKKWKITKSYGYKILRRKKTKRKNGEITKLGNKKILKKKVKKIKLWNFFCQITNNLNYQIV